MANLYNDEISNFIKSSSSITNDPLGLASGLSDKKKSIAKSTPWDQDPSANKDEVFWKPILIDPARWNKLYPYRLLVIDVNTTGKPRVVSGDSKASGGVQKYVGPEQGIEYIITQTADPGNWEMVLPITPQQLQIQDQFSINTSATMRGILEEHNGVKFKMITAAGTTGIWPQKPTKGGSIKQPSSLETIFSGTIESFGNVTEGIGRVANAFTGKHPNHAGDALKPEETSAGDFSTGYYQAMYLGQFLERYVQAKKDPANKGWRLVFDMPKQNQSFIVSPQAFNFSQSAQKPNEMMFNLQFKAWKRIDLEQNITPASSELPELSANLFQRIVGTIEETRRTLSQSTNLVKAVRSDFQRPFNVLRQASLAIKDVGGLVFSVIDLPRQIIEDAKDSIQDSLLNVSTAFNRGVSNRGGSAGNSSGSNLYNPLSSKFTSTASKAGAIVDSMVIRQSANEGLSFDEVSSGALGDDAAERLETDPLNNVFQNPEENFDLFNEISVEDLQLTSAQQDAVDEEIERIRLLTINDFRDFRNELLSLSTDISNNFGAGHQTYSDIYRVPQPRERALPLTIEENEILAALFESIQALDLLTSTKKYDDLNEQNPLEFVGGLADESGISFEQFSSKLLVPVPFGLTIEELAARYMGDVNKWLEIATLNKLRSPYIDEEGFQLILLSNADGRQFNIDNAEEKLFVGQKIILQSLTIPPFSRKIISIEKISDNNYLITVDGLANLDSLTTVDNARIKAFLPGTVNSQNQIYIPTNQPSDEDDRTFDIPGLNPSNLTKLSKVDFLLTDDFDIAINSVGDLRLANGLTNLIQALKIKIKVKKGTLLRHLDFGLGLEHGVSIADIEQGQILKELNEMIRGDSRYDFIESLTFTLRGPTLGIDLSVRLANNTGIVPISFNTRIV